MITGVAFCPQAPALVPEVGRGLDAELGELRAACRAATDRVLSGGARLEVVGDDAALAIGDHLVRDSVHPARAGHDNGSDHGSGAVALLVLGDGSARRTEKAPGYLDVRAEPFDRAVAAALASGDPAQLAALDAGLGTELLAAGVPAWHVAAARLRGERFSSELLYDDAPFGVGYFVASWFRA